MENHSIRLIAAMLASAAVSAAVTNGCVVPVKSTRGDAAEDAAGRGFLAESVIGDWRSVPRAAARRLIERHGVPDEVRPGHLVWNDRGPWKRIIARNATPPPSGPSEDLGVVEQTIRYPLTPGQVVDLKAYDRRLGYERVPGELGARSDREEVNVLRLNLADAIARRRLTPAQARSLHARILALEDAGKSSPYLRGLLFRAPPD